MRDIPKSTVAALVHDRGLLAALINAAASGTEIAPAARALIDAIMNPVITAIDLDDPQYQQGVAGLVAYGVITQSDADAVEALYVAQEVFTFTAIINGLAVYTGDRGTQRSIPVGPNFTPEMI